MQDIVIQYRGFSPSRRTQMYVEEFLQQLHEEAPKTAVIRASLSRSKGTLKGIVRISSVAGHFFAMATDVRLTELHHKLNTRIRKQLEKWKSKRHNHFSLKQKSPRDMIESPWENSTGLMSGTM